MSVNSVSDAVIKDIGEAYIALKDDYKTVCNACEKQGEKIAKLEADRDRLREALQELEQKTSGQCTLESLHNIAKQALKGG